MKDLTLVKQLILMEFRDIQMIKSLIFKKQIEINKRMNIKFQ